MQDYKAYEQAGLANEYEKLADYSLFMVCEKPNINAFRELPDGYSVRLCRRDELEVWKRVIDEERFVDYVTDYYDKIYAVSEKEFFKRCTFVCNAEDTPIASCFIWKSYGQVDTIAWFRTLPEHEGRGIGRALLSELLKAADTPIYLHTHPSAICAIKLYSDMGFALITNPAIGYRKNAYMASLPYMQKAMRASDYEKLRFVEVDDVLHKIALSSEISQF